MINLEEGEKIILEARRHWFIMGTTGSFLFLLAIAPIILGIVLAYVFPETSIVAGNPKFIALLSFFGVSWLLAIWIIFFMSWTDYYLDVLVITNKRLIDIEQKGFFRRNIATVPLGNIEDVKIEIAGPIRTFLKFGDIDVQTAGLSKELQIKNINLPAVVKQTILSAHHEYVAGKASIS